jgi:hypothetical protein
MPQSLLQRNISVLIDKVEVVATVDLSEHSLFVYLIPHSSHARVSAIGRCIAITLHQGLITSNLSQNAAI